MPFRGGWNLNYVLLSSSAPILPLYVHSVTYPPHSTPLVTSKPWGTFSLHPMMWYGISFLVLQFLCSERICFRTLGAVFAKIETLFMWSIPLLLPKPSYCSFSVVLSLWVATLNLHCFAPLLSLLSCSWPPRVVRPELLAAIWVALATLQTTAPSLESATLTPECKARRWRRRTRMDGYRSHDRET